MKASEIIEMKVIKPEILVVDDEPLNVELMEGILSMDYNVVTALSGIEALEKADKSLPDLILLDLMMPYMNGFAVCKEIKTSKRTMTIPIIVITALKENADKQKALDSGADDFMIKPVDIHELGIKMESLLMARSKGIWNQNAP